MFSSIAKIEFSNKHLEARNGPISLYGKKVYDGVSKNVYNKKLHNPLSNLSRRHAHK